MRTGIGWASVTFNNHSNILYLEFNNEKSDVLSFIWYESLPRRTI